MKTRPVVFIAACTVICFGLIAIDMALERFRQFGKLDGGVLLGAAFVITGFWALMRGYRQTD
jgi:hypothetical protein